MSYPDFINKLKLYTKSIAQNKPIKIDNAYFGEDIESFLSGKTNPPIEAVAALEHVYAHARADLLRNVTHTEYYEKYLTKKDSDLGVYEEFILPNYEKLRIGGGG